MAPRARRLGPLRPRPAPALAALDDLPPSDPRRNRLPDLMPILQELARSLRARQDAQNGGWLNLMNLDGRPPNHVETSCSAMHAYVIGRAVQRGCVDRSLLAGTPWPQPPNGRSHPAHETAARRRCR